jgi:hypothetical protein
MTKNDVIQEVSRLNSEIDRLTKANAVFKTRWAWLARMIAEQPMTYDEFESRERRLKEQEQMHETIRENAETIEKLTIERDLTQMRLSNLHAKDNDDPVISGGDVFKLISLFVLLLLTLVIMLGLAIVCSWVFLNIFEHMTGIKIDLLLFNLTVFAGGFVALLLTIHLKGRFLE